MNKAQSGWTEDRLAKLRELWDKKLSITKIGEELGVSRNAVAGKAHRLGLEKRQSPIKPSIKPKTQKNEWDETLRGPMPLRLVLRSLEWSRNKCLWPYGDPKNLDFKFCGEPVLSGKPYCLKHCELAYNNSKD
jgi:GcrA cell cycle regulator|tara:strand:+ start:178 stop:576 length:399 start_codon:yes stop_codon:yes gene_type:complete